MEELKKIRDLFKEFHNDYVKRTAKLSQFIKWHLGLTMDRVYYNT